MDKYLTKFKATVNTFYNEAKKIKAEKEKNTNMYRQDIADEQNAILDAKFYNLAGLANQQVDQILDEAKKHVSEWDKAKGSELNTDDAKLFTSGLDLSADDLTALAEKYHSNATISKMIMQYAEKHHVVMDTDLISTAKQRVEAYAALASGASSVINDIMHSPNGSEWIDLEVTGYANAYGLSGRLYYAIDAE
ncbi:MAG: hypothetical protein LKF79_07665 [Solobacterium sp.]|nr:hypothetical protein [Solobacterium sp.]